MNHENYVTIFGASSPSDEETMLAYDVGKAIAKCKYVLVNGGYGGTMEASAKGCRENGGTVIGVCIKGHAINSFNGPNTYNTEVIEALSLNQRIETLLHSKYIVALDGSLGTLQELISALALNFFENQQKKLIVVGKRNQQLIEYLHNNRYIDDGLYRETYLPKNVSEFKKIFEGNKGVTNDC